MQTHTHTQATEKPPIYLNRTDCFYTEKREKLQIFKASKQTNKPTNELNRLILACLH